MGQKLFPRRPDTGNTFVVAHPLTGVFVPLEQGKAYEETDPLVQAHRWAFVAADELGDTNDQPTFRESVDIPEMATRRPGEKRATRRSR